MPAIRVAEFDVWRPGYGNRVVTVYLEGTTTKASLYTNEALSVAASNPQTLQRRDIDGVSYGKFAQPLYVGAAYYIDTGGEQTGVIRPPLTTLSGQDASSATATASGGSRSRTIAEHLGKEVWAIDHGEIGPSIGASTNDATIERAAGVAAALGGGRVCLPAGTIPYNDLVIAAGVVLEGRGRGVTTLQSSIAGKAITASGDRAGLKDLTVDGVSKQANSVGFYSKAKNETYLDNVQFKRLQSAIKQQGARGNNWREVYVDGCTNAVLGWGDNDASAGGGGDEFRNNEWVGGKVSNCTAFGVDLSFVDKKCWHNTIRDVGFEDNTGVATRINGARHTWLPGCWWRGNTTDIVIQDDDDTTKVAENTVVGVHISGSISGGAVTLKDTLQDVTFDGMELSDVDFTLTLPKNNVLLLDCIEDANVTIAGDGTKITRARRILGDMPASSGVTTDATATKAWSYNLAPGEIVNIEAVVIGNARNSEEHAFYHIARAAERDGSELAYDEQTANFTLGAILTGAASGCTARVVADADSGTTGTLTLRDIIPGSRGYFINNEAISDSSGGAAIANGELVSQNAALLGSTTSVQAAVESDAAMACDFAASGTEIQVQVTGLASKTFEWTVSARVTSSG